MHAWLLGVVAGFSSPIGDFVADPKDPLKNIELIEGNYAHKAASLAQQQMRTTAQSVAAKSQAAQRVFAEQFKEGLKDIDNKGIITAPEVRQFYSMAKANLASMIQKTSDAELNNTASEADQEFYAGVRLGIARFMCDVDAINLLEPYATAAGETAKFVGSGFIVKNDENGPLIVTNAHVVNDAAKVEVQFPSNGQEPYRAQPVHVNHDWDIAVVRLHKEEVPKLAQNLADKGQGELPVVELYDGPFTSGMEVVAAGYPLGSPTCAITMGIVSGMEQVSGSTCVQSTAPISPGNSGGPLFKKGTQQVVGINFAASSSELAQNVNYVIPSYRVMQVLKHLEAGEADFTVDKCAEKPTDCDMNVAKVNAVTVPGSPALFAAHGCESGVLVTKVAERSLLAHAEPAIEADMFITEVNGVHLDRFGMGIHDEYFQDPVHYHDIMFMNKDLKDSPAKVKTCSCGKETEHTVDLQWDKSYASLVPDVPQPSLAHLDFERVGDLVIQPVNEALAKAFVTQAGRLNLVDFVVNVDHEPALIVTGAPEPTDMSGANIEVGSIISKVNNQPVRTLKELRQAFTPKPADSCSGEKESLLQKSDRPQIFTVETQDGAFYGVPFKATLEDMIKQADADHPITKTGLAAAEALGLDTSKLDSASLLEGVIPSSRLRSPERQIELPIEARAIDRGGRTRKLTFLEEIHAIVPPQQMHKLMTKMSAALEAHNQHLEDRAKRDKAKTPSLLERDSDEQQDQDDAEKLPNWFDGLVDLTKPLAAGLGM